MKPYADERIRIIIPVSIQAEILSKIFWHPKEIQTFQKEQKNQFGVWDKAKILQISVLHIRRGNRDNFSLYSFKTYLVWTHH